MDLSSRNPLGGWKHPASDHQIGLHDTNLTSNRQPLTSSGINMRGKSRTSTKLLIKVSAMGIVENSFY
ncbi:hypothetical protein IGI04_040768 [Brassica rapa subsp. trilocularis]|uniref:Uncharacterized protein n=1 Tax=Brassica rapa subsp. trilocularis TaxID=1813537 RepID=A0ABQ7KPI1_BRACM|nr:hypothetical protein IGI04_040768 [Brassica rapa subsp. trilocularis]